MLQAAPALGSSGPTGAASSSAAAEKKPPSSGAGAGPAERLGAAGAGELSKRSSFTSNAFLLIQAASSAGWLVLGYKSSTLLRFWGMRRATLLVTAATGCLVAVTVLALIARVCAAATRAASNHRRRAELSV